MDGMAPGSQDLDNISARDVAAYIRDVSNQLADMAHQTGLDTLARCLEQAHQTALAVLKDGAAGDEN